jgi:hypothetical protein
MNGTHWTAAEIAALEPHLMIAVSHAKLHELIPTRSTTAIRCQLAKMRKERGIEPRNLNREAISPDASFERAVKKATLKLHRKFAVAWEAVLGQHIDQMAA